jgi:hypothetical protein
MKYAILLTVGAAFALSACQESGQSADEATASDTATAPETTVAAAAPAPATAAAFTIGQPPSKEFMVGTWGEGEACDQPINFQADGTVKDGPVDTWKLEDGKLVMDDLIMLNLKVVDANTMESQPDGATDWKTIKRCD